MCQFQQVITQATNFKDAPTLPGYSLNRLGLLTVALMSYPFNSVVDFPRPVNVNNAQQEAFLISSTNAFTKQMGVSRENNLMDYSIGGTASNQYNISDKVSIGFIASMNYKFDTDYYESAVNRSVAVRNGEQEDFDGQEGELGTTHSHCQWTFGCINKDRQYLSTKQQSLQLEVEKARASMES